MATPRNRKEKKTYLAATDETEMATERIEINWDFRQRWGPMGLEGLVAAAGATDESEREFGGGALGALGVVRGIRWSSVAKRV